MTISQALAGRLIVSYRNYRVFFSQLQKKFVVYHGKEIIATFRYKSHTLRFMKSLAPLRLWTFNIQALL